MKTENLTNVLMEYNREPTDETDNLYKLIINKYFLLEEKLSLISFYLMLQCVTNIDVFRTPARI